MRPIETTKSQGQWDHLTDREHAAYLFGISTAIQFLEHEVGIERDKALSLAEKVSVLRYDTLKDAELRKFALQIGEVITEIFNEFNKYRMSKFN